MPSQMVVSVVASDRNAYVQVSTDGQQTAWIKFKDGPSAQAGARAIELGIEDSTDITLAEFFNRWMTYHGVPCLGSDTVSDYLSVMSTIVLPKLGAMQLQNIGTSDLDAFTEALSNEGHTNRRIGSALNILSSVLGVAVRWLYCTSNPVATIDTLRLANAPV